MEAAGAPSALLSRRQGKIVTLAAAQSADLVIAQLREINIHETRMLLR